MDPLISNAQRIVEDFSKEPGMNVYFEFCHGLVLLSAVEASFLFSGQVGTGLLLRHDKNNESWSPPCAIQLTGVGAGIQAGVEKKDILLFLTEKSMVKTLSGEFQLRIGSQVTLTVGTEGEEDDFYAHFSNRGIATVSSFAHTRGLAVGVSMEGGILTPRNKLNQAFYGEQVSPKKILFGQVTVPESCNNLRALHNSLDVAISYVVDKKLEDKDKDKIFSNAFLRKPRVNQVHAVEET